MTGLISTDLFKSQNQYLIDCTSERNIRLEQMRIMIFMFRAGLSDLPFRMTSAGTESPLLFKMRVYPPVRMYLVGG